MNFWAGVLICAVHQGFSFFSLRTVQPSGQAWFAASSLVCSQHTAGIKEQFLELSLQSLSLEVSLAARTFLILDEPCL